MANHRRGQLLDVSGNEPVAKNSRTEAVRTQPFRVLCGVHMRTVCSPLRLPNVQGGQWGSIGEWGQERLSILFLKNNISKLLAKVDLLIILPRYTGC